MRPITRLCKHGVRRKPRNRMKKKPGQIRIIGGHHRSRRIDVPDLPGLRPTSDRVREVLFNWLMPHLHGAAVLDLYAGSGALGFEAASRMARRVVMVDANARAVQHLLKTCETLKLDTVEAVCQRADAFLEGSHEAFDVIFLDPPFSSAELSAISDKIGPHCTRGGLLYRECPASEVPPPMEPLHWQLLKHKRVAQVLIELWQKT